MNYAAQPPIYKTEARFRFPAPNRPCGAAHRERLKSVFNAARVAPEKLIRISRRVALIADRPLRRDRQCRLKKHRRKLAPVESLMKHLSMISSMFCSSHMATKIQRRMIVNGCWTSSNSTQNI
jgi:hypothetical protein